MSFLSPIWLWAGAAIAVPLVIHLLSRGRGQVISVGTVRFLPAARSHRLRRIRPSGLWRLLLRAALLASLAVALAAPRWWRSAEARPDDHWQLVDPALLIERDRLEPAASEIFERLAATPDAERRLLAPGLPRWPDGIPTGPLATDLWSLAAEAAVLVPPEAKLEFFVLDRAETLEGVRPDLGRLFEWWVAADSEPNRWIQRLVWSDDGLLATVGTSTAEGTRFATHTLSHQEGTGELGREAFDDRDEVFLGDGGSRSRDDRVAIPLASEPFRAVVAAAPDRDADVATVRRATKAVATHLGRPLVLTSNLGPEGEVDLLVDLRDEDAPAPIPAAVTLSESATGSALCQQLAYVDALPDPWLTLRRCSVANGVPALWRNGWGAPLLSVGSIGAGRAYRWHGRLDPSWSSVGDAALPHLLLKLVAPEDEGANGSTDAGSDRRAAVAGHGRPTGTVGSPPVVADRTPERLAWAIVAVLFLADRFLVRRPS